MDLVGELERVVGALRDASLDYALCGGTFSAGTPNEREIHRISKVESGALATIDLLVVTPVFEPIWADRIHVDWRGQPVCVVSLDGLARMKRLAGRRQDLADLESLGLPQEDEGTP